MPPFQDFLLRQAAAYRAEANKYLLLTNDSSYTDASPKAEIVAAEINPQFGYTRQPVTITTEVYDSGQARVELQRFEADFTATGGTIQYDRAVLVSGAGNALSNAPTNGIDASANRLSFAASNAFTSAGIIQVTVTADGGGGVPSELLDSGNPRLLYIVNPVNSGTFTIQLALTNGGSAIDFSGGSGTLRVRNCDFKMDFYEPYGASEINDGATQTIEIGLNVGNNAANVNAI